MKTYTKEERDRYGAYHEAGHAVVALALGANVDKMTLDGVHYHYTRDEDELVVCAAGEIAAWKAGMDRDAAELTALHDYEAAEKCMDRMTSHKGMAFYISASETLVKKHWNGICCVAEALLIQKHLTGEQVLELASSGLKPK